MKHKKILKTLIKEFKEVYSLYRVELKIYDFETNLNAYELYIQKNVDDTPIRLCDRYFTNKELREFLFNLIKFNGQIKL